MGEEEEEEGGGDGEGRCRPEVYSLVGDDVSLRCEPFGEGKALAMKSTPRLRSTPFWPTRSSMLALSRRTSEDVFP